MAPLEGILCPANSSLLPCRIHDIKELTSRQFVYEDMWCGMVPFDGQLSELQTGPPERFADLHWRDRADILRSFIHWDRYPERAWNDEYTISDNIEAGKPPEAWLEGTSLRQSFQHLAEGKTPPPVQLEPDLKWEDLPNLFFGQDNYQPEIDPQHGASPAEQEGRPSLIDRVHTAVSPDHGHTQENGHEPPEHDRPRGRDR
jgi:hypothetical protein